ncbi:uncharacterized protein LOC134540484 isoform X1 [Bacillus rossius redtenbacheri]
MDVLTTFFAVMASVFFGVCAVVSVCMCFTTLGDRRWGSLIGCKLCRKNGEKVYILQGKDASPRMGSGQDELMVSYSAGSASKTATVFHFPSSVKPLSTKQRKPVRDIIGREHEDPSESEPELKEVLVTKPTSEEGNRRPRERPSKGGGGGVRERMSCFSLGCLRRSQSLPSLLGGPGGGARDLDDSSLDDLCSRFDSSVLSFSREDSRCTERDEFLSLVLSPGSRSSLWQSAESSSGSCFSFRSTRTLVASDAAPSPGRYRQQRSCE